MSVNRFVQLTSTTPTKLFGLFLRKGTIAVGSDADIVLFDPNETWTIKVENQHEQVDYTLNEGREVTGRVKKAFLRGSMVVDGEEWHGAAGMGRLYVAAKPAASNATAHLRRCICLLAERIFKLLDL